MYQINFIKNCEIVCSHILNVEMSNAEQVPASVTLKHLMLSTPWHTVLH